MIRKTKHRKGEEREEQEGERGGGEGRKEGKFQTPRQAKPVDQSLLKHAREREPSDEEGAAEKGEVFATMTPGSCGGIES